ncbi:hypothetical protein EXU34_00445 [Alteromonas sp. ZYF713]|nr:hypothetical protein [Alteromonas sp. ZYF713]
MKYTVLIALFVTLSGSARGSVTAEPLEVFKSSIKQGCIARGIERQDDSAVAFCSCMDKVLRSALSDAEFAEIAKQAAAGKPISQIAPFKALIPQIAGCKEVDSKA